MSSLPCQLRGSALLAPLLQGVCSNSPFGRFFVRTIILFVCAWTQRADIFSSPAGAGSMAKLLTLEAASGEGNVLFDIKSLKTKKDAFRQSWGVKGQEKGSCWHLLATLGYGSPAGIFHLGLVTVVPWHVEISGYVFIRKVLGGLAKPDHTLGVVQAPVGRDPDRHITNLGKFQQIVGVYPTVDLDQHSFAHPFPLCGNRHGSINGFVQDGAIGSSQSFVRVQTFDNKESGKPFILCCCGFRATREIRIVCHWGFRVSIKGISWGWGWAWGWRLILSWHAHICGWRRLAVCHQDYIHAPLRIGTKFAKKAPAMAKNKGHPATHSCLTP